MKRLLLATGITFLLFAGPSVSLAAGLTEVQIQAVIGLLQSFGVDSSTIASAESAMRGQPVTVTTPTNTGGFTFTRALSIGATGSEVTELQTVLKNQGYFTVTPTGYFGPATAAAVTSFQKANNLEPIGSIGPLTRTLLNQIVNKGDAGSSGGSGTSNPSTTPTPNSGGTPSMIQNYTPPVVSGGSGGGGGGGSVVTPPVVTPPVTTPPADTTPPTITATGPSSSLAVGTAQATLAVSTNESASCVYSTSQGFSFSAGAAFTTTGGTAHSVLLSGLSNGTSYTYYVQCKDAAGNIRSSSVSFAVATPAADTSAPSVPGNLTATANSSSQITVMWSASTDNFSVTGYQIFRNGAASAIAQVTSLTYANTGLTPNTLYTYTVKAIDAAGNLSGASASKSATTLALSDTTPPTVTITAPAANLAAGTTATSLSATTNESATCRYSTNSSFTYSAGTLFSTTGGTAHTTTLSGLANSTSYTYYVKCQDTAGNTSGNASVTFSVATPPDTAAPSAPAGLTAATVSSSQINLSWTASTDNVAVSGYKVFRGAAQIATTTSPSYSNTGLNASTNYSYTVKAFDAANNVSAASTAASATTQAAAGAGGTCPRGTAYPDGCSAASNVNVQMPNLLSGYATRAPWNVAGVDYPVGIHAGINLKNPATAALPANVTRDLGNKWILVNGDTTLDGWDFSGGWNVLVYHGSSITITNNDFTGSHLTWRADGDATGGTIRYNIFNDQNQNLGGTTQFIVYRPGVYTVEYNWFDQSYYQGFQITNGDPGQTLYFRYNIISNTGGGSPQGAHGDWIQMFGDYNVNDVQINYNTVVQNLPTYATQGFSLNASNPTIQTGSISNNTIVVKNGVNYAVYLVPHWNVGPFTIKNNYVDPAGIGQFAQLDTTWAGPYPGNTIDLSSNINMVTSANNYGGVVTPGGSQPDTTAPSTPANLAASAVSTSQINLTWSASTDSVGVTGYVVFRGGVQIATPATNSYSDTGLSASTNYSYTVKAKDAAGNTSAASAAANATTQAVVVSAGCNAATPNDGCSGAPAGTAQRPTLFSGYATRPSWKVAGVDYYVGVPQNITLKDPSTAAVPAGVSRNAANRTFTVTGNNVIIDGYDFSLGGGWQVYVTTGNDPIIRNNNFKIGTNGQDPIVLLGAANDPSFGRGGSIINNTIDGNNTPAAFNGLVFLSRGGTGVVQYNWIKNSVSDFINLGADTLASGKVTTFDIRYNLLDQGGTRTDLGYHADWQQTFANNHYNSITWNYNTVVQTITFPGGGGTQGTDFQGNCNAPLARFDGGTVSNNSVVLTSTPLGAVNFVFAYAPDVLSGTLSFTNNFVDSTSLTQPSWQTFRQDDCGGTQHGTVTLSGNTNLKDGTQPSGWNTAGGTTPPASDTTAPTVTILSPSGVLAAGTTQTTLSVSTNEAAMCSRSNTAGTAFAAMTAFSSTGGTTHSTTLTGLTNGSSYTTYVKCKDTAGNISADFSRSYSVANTQQQGDTTPPTITITSPQNGAVVTSSPSVLSVNASDNVGVVQVTYTANGASITVTQAPFTLTTPITNAYNATYLMTATAQDAAGNTTTSAPITFTINLP